MNVRNLVIDDDPGVTGVLRRGLSYEGYEVDGAASGREGLDRAREYAPDLVILDVMMPGIDGLEVCRLIHPFAPSILEDSKASTSSRSAHLKLHRLSCQPKAFRPIADCL